MISLVDIFAGPGGLSEGFAAVKKENGESAFNVVLSIEKDTHAYQTLKLRAFYRQYQNTFVPEDYYRVLRGDMSPAGLYARHPENARMAESCTWHAELGSSKCYLNETRRKIEKALGGSNHWVLIGGPPCQAYSIAGRSRRKGITDYNPDMDLRQRLYVEYLQILADHQPIAFIMENVKGLLSAKLEGQRIFHRIIEDLENPVAALRRENRSIRGNNQTCYMIYSLVERTLFNDGDIQNSVVEADKYGIPQTRHRIILLGIREDLGNINPNILIPSEKVASSLVLEGLPAIRSSLSRKSDSARAWEEYLHSQVSRRWVNAGTRKVDSEDLSKLIRQILNGIKSPDLDCGAEFIPIDAPTKYATDWFCDSRLGGICNHSSRGHIAKDLCRYIYASCYAKMHGYSPLLHNFPTDLLPNHSNVSKALNKGNNFSDRFRVQVWNSPAKTITSHISKDGHYYIHPDPYQCRSFTVREAARLQTFPDNYFFCGPRTAQYVQVGNAVPPLLARQIGEIVFGFLSRGGIDK